MIRCFSVIFLLLLQYSHQQDTVGGRDILQHLSVIMNARFAVLDRRLNHMASMMTDLKPQHDQAHLEENISNIENNMKKIEENMKHMKTKQEKQNEFMVTAVQDIKEAINNLQTLTRNSSNDNKVYIKDLQTLTSNSSNDIKDYIKESQETIINNLTTNITDLQTLTSNSSNDIMDYIKDLQTLTSNSSKVIKDYIKDLQTLTSNSSNNIKDYINESQETIINDLTTNITDLQTLTSNCSNDIMDYIKESQETIINKLTANITDFKASNDAEHDTIMRTLDAICSDSCGNISGTCSPGYTGASCRTPVCSDGCVYGQCTSPGNCTCSTGYTGASCRTPVCSDGCGNGQCTSPDKCTCSPEYTGASCITHCPESEGFFVAPGTRQCMKAITNDHTWDSAVSLCRSQGLKLAKPQDAAALNQYLYEKHGHKWYWVSARGTWSGGWQWTDGEVLPLSDPLWRDGQPDYTSRGYCLYLGSHPIARRAGTPYYDADCSDTWYMYPLCEVIGN